MSLSELLERVKAASGPDREIDCALACHLDGFWANLKLWPSRPIGANLMEWRLRPQHPTRSGRPASAPPARPRRPPPDHA